MTGSTERRKHPRVHVGCPVRIQGGGANVEGTVVDLSLGGACCRAAAGRPWALDEKVALAIELPGLDEPIAVEATVRWVDPIDTQRFGVQFTAGLRPREVYAVNALFRKQQG